MGFNYSLLDVVPLENGKKTTHFLGGRKLYLENGQEITKEVILRDPASFDGKKIGNGKEASCFRDPGYHAYVRVSGSNVYLESDSYNEHLNPEFDLGDLDLTKKADELLKDIGTTRHITRSKSLAEKELSVVFGPSGSGKTLSVIYDVAANAHQGVINAEDVIYVNLDDSAHGLAEKAKLLGGVGIKMIKEFDQRMVGSMVRADICSNKVLIIDTVKKIVNLNDKTEVVQLMKTFKKFTHAGGTVVLIAHSNKHLVEGVPVIEGVGDLKNDADCVVSVTRSDDLMRWSNEKDRCYVEKEVVFQVGSHKDYRKMLISMRQLSPDEASDLLLQRSLDQFMVEHLDIINEIIESIEDGMVKKTELSKKISSETGESRKMILTVLHKLEGKRWRVEKGLNNSKVYSLIEKSLSDRLTMPDDVVEGVEVLD